MITGLPDCLRRKLGVCGFEFLKAHDVGLRFAKPAEQVRQATVDVVDVETGDLHRFSYRHAAWVSVRRRTSTASDTGSAAGQTGDTSSISSERPLTISCGVNNQKVVVIVSIRLYVVSQFEAVGSLDTPPPRPGHGMVGGVAAHSGKSAGASITFQASKTIVATALRCVRPRPWAQHGGGVAAHLRNLLGPHFHCQASEKQLLRQRCDACGFNSLPVEIIARQKVAPAFEPQKLSWRTARPGLHRNPRTSEDRAKRVTTSAPRGTVGRVGRCGRLQRSLSSRPRQLIAHAPVGRMASHAGARQGLNPSRRLRRRDLEQIRIDTTVHFPRRRARRARPFRAARATASSNCADGRSCG